MTLYICICIHIYIYVYMYIYIYINAATCTSPMPVLINSALNCTAYTHLKCPVVPNHTWQHPLNQISTTQHQQPTIIHIHTQCRSSASIKTTTTHHHTTTQHHTNTHNHIWTISMTESDLIRSNQNT